MLTAALCVLAFSGGFIAGLIYAAPYGWEDERGWHAGIEPPDHEGDS